MFIQADNLQPLLYRTYFCRCEQLKCTHDRPNSFPSYFSQCKNLSHSETRNQQQSHLIKYKNEKTIHSNSTKISNKIP